MKSVADAFSRCSPVLFWDSCPFWEAEGNSAGFGITGMLVRGLRSGQRILRYHEQVRVSDWQVD